MAKTSDMKKVLARRVGRGVARLVALVRDSSQTIVEPADAREVIRANNPFIFAMWHGQFMMLPALQDSAQKVSAMVARHGDAEIIGEVLSRFDIDLVRGAGAGDRKKDRGGAYALRSALRLLAGGTTLAMTADVPPGPARRAGLGIVTLARMSGRPVIPFAAATSRYVALRTWSRMTINLPYGRLAFVIGSPIHVPHDADEDRLEACRAEIEAALNAATRRAYELAGADPRRATPPGAAAADGRAPEPGLALKGYRVATEVMRPAAGLILGVREREGKEDPSRRNERFGIASVARPTGQLVWVHAASVGETNAALPLMAKLGERHGDLSFLLTTGTTTSAMLAAARLPSRAVHQYVPLDARAYARRFLDHWRPDAALFVESEIWPNLILETSSRGIPLALLNARLSPRSFKRWQKTPRSAAALFGRFDVILAQNDRVARLFRSLGARHVVEAGNLKIDAPPPPVDGAALARLEEALCGRRVLVAASTHEGEEAMVAEAHRSLSREMTNLCTIIVPRHPERGTAISDLLKARGLSVGQRSLGALPNPRTEIYIADTIGELGTIYRLGPVAFVGGSLIEHGGQNPVEAVMSGAVVLTGPWRRNFRDTYDALLRHKGAIEVRTAADIARVSGELFRSPSQIEEMQAGARAALVSLGGALERSIVELEALLPVREGLRRAS